MGLKITVTNLSLDAEPFLGAHTTRYDVGQAKHRVKGHIYNLILWNLCTKTATVLHREVTLWVSPVRQWRVDGRCISQ